MQLSIPDEAVAAWGLTEQDLLRELAVALYRHGEITVGHGCKLTRRSEVDFQRLLDGEGVDLRYPECALDDDLAALRRALWPMCEDAAICGSDTTAITNLSAVGRLDLMESIFRRVLIPEAVYQELTAHADGVLGAREVYSSLWVEVRGVRDGTLVHRLRRSLDLGEAEAIALALECDAKILIIDEYAGRQAALALGIPIVGVLGILIEAKPREGCEEPVAAARQLR